jgi:hypothetical protein
MIRTTLNAVVALATATALCNPATAVTFTSSYTDGGSWGETGLYAQGFNPFVHDPGDPGIGEGAPIYLTNLRFFKSGLADTAGSIRLAIVNDIYLNLEGLTADPMVSANFVGLSTNTLPSTASLATGAPFDFQFNGLELTYGEFNYYAAIFVNVGAGGALTPVLVSTLRADYIETPAGSGIYLPESNYGDPDPTMPLDNRLATSNFTHTDDFGTFFDTFGGNADANFVATYSTTVPSTPGDYDGDGNVDGDDLTKWKMGFGTAVLDADGDGDLDVDGNDFLIWQRNLGAGAAAPVAVSAPEPAAVVLAGLAALAFRSSARRRGNGGVEPRSLA